VATADQFLRHVRRVQAQLTGSFGVGGGQIGGKLSAGSFGLIFKRDQLVGECAGPSLDLTVLF
jgi:hypothetical protein